MRAGTVHAAALAVPFILACSLMSKTAAPQPTAAAPVPEISTGTSAPGVESTSTAQAATPEACTPDTLKAYLRQFAMPMAGYEYGLIQVYSITNVSNGSASADQYNAAIGMIQTSRDTIAALVPPDCAAKMQADMLASMDDMKAAIQLRISGASTAQFEAAMAKTKAEQKTAEDEFGVLSARAGLDAAAPTP